MYGGRATRQTLRLRLKQHYAGSHNPQVRAHAHELWYRCQLFETVPEAEVVEGLFIAAFDYPWNQRNEWKQQWAMDC